MTHKKSLTYIGWVVVIPNREPDVVGTMSHPLQHDLLELLAEADCSFNAIAEHFQMCRPVVSQHFRILLDAGLMTEQRHGGEFGYSLVPAQLRPVPAWMAYKNRFWDRHAESREKHLTERDE